jgi:MFS family permease
MGTLAAMRKSGDKDKTLFHGGVFSALGRRDYRVLWSGAFVSNVGTWVHTAVLLWLVKDMTGSNAWVGAVNMASYLPVLIFVLPAGSLADYLDRKKLILWGQVVMMAGALALAVLTTVGLDSLPAIMVTTGVMGIAFALNFPAWQSVLPDLVPREDLLNAIALSAAQFNLARFIGPAIGGLIVVWSAAAAFYFNALSFLFVIVALLLVRTETPGYPRPPEGMTEHIKEGVRFVLGFKWMVTLLVSVAVISFFGFALIVLVPSLARDVLGRGSGGYGLLLGILGLGAFAGAPLVTYLGERVGERNVMRVSALTLGLSMTALSFSRAYWLSCVLLFGVGMSFLMMSASINTLLQGDVDREIRGRIMSLFIMMLVGVFPIGGQVLGLISDATSTPTAILIGGSACTALALVLLAFRGLTDE